MGTAKNDRLFIIVQEYLSGGTLQDKLAFDLDWNDTLRIGKEICQGMDFAHKHQIIHGHLRPTNILFTDDGKVKLTDFGLQDDISEVRNAQYYALKDEAPGTASDIYSVGVILYQLLTGSLPRQEQQTRHAVRKSFMDLPGDIQELITTMLSTIPERRHKDSLRRCIKIFDAHLNITGTGRKPADSARQPAEDEEDGKRRDDITAITMPKTADSELEEEPVFVLAAQQRMTPIQKTRTYRMFAVLLLLFSQYMLFFEGQEKLNDVVPVIYSQVADGMEGFFGN
jgi:serine/threonine protein kinase